MDGMRARRDPLRLVPVALEVLLQSERKGANRA